MTVLDERIELLYSNINSETGADDTVTSPNQMTPDQHPHANVERECYTCGTEFIYNRSSDDMMLFKTYEYGGSMTRWVEKHHYICDRCTSRCGSCDDVRPASSDDVGWRNILNTRFLNDLCESCTNDYYMCERCDDAIYMDDVNLVSGDSAYCNSCVQRVASWCSDCDQYEWTEDLCTPHDDNIHNYGYKPSPVFYGQDADNEHMYFGMELEVEAKRADLGEGSQLMTDEWGEFAYLKEDGSLNFGFEIVTHPASLKYYQNAVDWNTIVKLREMGFRSWDAGTCGIHIHIDRRAFKDRTHIMAMSMLINNNQGLTQHIAGRNSSYGQIGEVAKRDNIQTIKGNRWGNAGQGGERYLAINLQNTNTIELRMFKGSLKIERILSAIEYSHAVVTYSRDIRNGINAKTMFRPEEFTSWVRKQGKYPNLVQFLPDFDVTNNDNEMETEE